MNYYNDFDKNSANLSMIVTSGSANSMKHPGAIAPAVAAEFIRAYLET